MKKYLKLLTLLFVLFLGFNVVGCDKKTDNTTIGIPYNFDQIVVEAEETVDYDKNFHFPTVTGAPDDAEIIYNPDRGGRYPGEYEFEVTVKIGNQEKTYNSKIIIVKPVVTATCESEQTWYLSDGPAHAVCETSNQSYLPNEYEYFYKAGDYTTVVSFPESSIYEQIEDITVTLHVVNSRSGYYLENGSYVLDGDDPVVVTAKKSDTTNEELYDLVYENCELTTQGTFYSKCKVYEKGTQNLVDELRALSIVDYPDNEEFKDYELEMFKYFMEGDQLSVNIFMEDYTKFGLEHSDATWYAYEEYTDDEYGSDLEEIDRLREEFDSYKDKKLSFAQINTCGVIEKNIIFYEDLFADKKNILMKQSYIDQFGGYCADFPTDMEAYSLRTLEDITDMISYVDSSYDAFMSYVDYAKAREEAGYGFSETTLTKMIEFLNGVAEKGNDYYLVGVLRKKIEDAKTPLNLTDDQLNNYLDSYDSAAVKMINAFKDLKDALQEYLDEAKAAGGYLADPEFKEGYLSVYEDGKDLYQSILKNILGTYSLSMDDYIKYIDECMKSYRSTYSLYSGKVTKEAEKITKGMVDITGSNTPEGIIEYLKDFAKTIVPELEEEPDIDFTEMDSTATANTTTVAYYMKSALDSTDSEHIHLNPKQLGKNKFETISTIAHEGYPGHLYAYVYSKEADNLSNLVRIMTSTGHGEGWAKYVEFALGEYIINQHKDDDNAADWENAILSENYWGLYAYLLYTRIDVGIMYQGWDAKAVGSYMNGQGLVSDSAGELFEQLIEMPGQYAAYGYGASMFYEWHVKAKEALGTHYNEVLFNNAMLEHGWIGYDQLNPYLEQFINNQKFVLYID